MTEKSNLPPYLLEHTLWEKGENSIWLSTTFTLHRNLSKYPFPSKITQTQMQQTFTLLKERLCNNPKLANPLFLNAELISPIDKEFLFEHFLCPEGFQNTLAGQGFAIDESGHFFAEVNIQNHLKLHLIDCTASWEKAWNLLDEIEMAIGSNADFAFSSKFGYLTSEPYLCGTGLKVQAFLHIPALVHTQQLQETLLKQKEESITFTGMRGTLSELIGDILVIENNYTLGETEQGILHAIQSMSMKLMALEKTLRTHLQGNDNAEIKDQVSRAFGLLLHSYQLQTKEALGALSLIRLGRSMEWVTGITDEKLNHLFFACRRAHLLHHLGDPHITEPQEISRKRAEFLHKNMQGVALTFEV